MVVERNYITWDLAQVVKYAKDGKGCFALYTFLYTAKFTQSYTYTNSHPLLSETHVGVKYWHDVNEDG